MIKEVSQALVQLMHHMYNKNKYYFHQWDIWKMTDTEKQQLQFQWNCFLRIEKLLLK